MDSKILFDFNKNVTIQNWVVVDDIVMGGKSSGSFTLNKQGMGEFKGEVSLENNGGFSSVRYRFNPVKIEKLKRINLRIKGDGKSYQFRVKSKVDEYYSFVYTFKTSKDWETIVIPLKDMYPSFRGRKLDMSNFNKENIEEIAFLIGNKRQEKFQLLIDKIELK